MLAERLDTIRQGADKRIPPDKRAIMHRATDDLRASGRWFVPAKDCLGTERCGRPHTGWHTLAL